MNKTQEDEGGEFDCTMEDPPFLLMARQAEIYLEGGYGLEKNPSNAGQSPCVEGFAPLETVSGCGNEMLWGVGMAGGGRDSSVG